MEAADSKWVAVVASIWIQCSCGASYAFGIYSPLLKSTKAYYQSTLDTISVFKDIGANVGVLSGILYSAINLTGPRSRFLGPWMVHAAGAIQCFMGYCFLLLAVTLEIVSPHVPVHVPRCSCSDVLEHCERCDCCTQFSQLQRDDCRYYEGPSFLDEHHCLLIPKLLLHLRNCKRKKRVFLV